MKAVTPKEVLELSKICHEQMADELAIVINRKLTAYDGIPINIFDLNGVNYITANIVINEYEKAGWKITRKDDGRHTAHYSFVEKESNGTV